MMDCQHYRRTILANPREEDAQLRLHRESCEECSRYGEEVRRFEHRLERALRVSMEAAPAGMRQGTPWEVPASARRSPVWRGVRRRYAVAASLLLGFVLAGGLWVAFPRPSLAADVVGHMAGEPGAWTRTRVPVPEPLLDKVLGESQLRLTADAGLVSYAHSCLFRGHQVPHLVVQTDSGPVTVMVLTHESPRAAVRFDEQGYRGIIVPVPNHGSIAVLERGPDTGMATVEAVAAQVLRAIEWTA
jgi:hypothetical protein